MIKEVPVKTVKKTKTYEEKTFTVPKLTPYEQGRLDERRLIVKFVSKFANPFTFYNWRGYQVATHIAEEIINGRHFPKKK